MDFEAKDERSYVRNCDYSVDDVEPRNGNATAKGLSWRFLPISDSDSWARAGCYLDNMTVKCIQEIHCVRKKSLAYLLKIFNFFK
ncbi:hypothetical protein RRG08_030379 [Elysia crispata]|uniref:Uncharacterized protein n=1 Tax=Elysia crispata TaxID=231223 RepID=A0AAE0YGB5_9GAST|nr:hypothetical protein RRG08_030379 [Elysia crispata]